MSSAHRSPGVKQGINQRAAVEGNEKTTPAEILQFLRSKSAGLSVLQGLR